MAETPLHRLGEHGQSVWLDFISRELVTTDRLQRLIDERNVTGMTSNPTIFEKAIVEGTDYDDQIRDLVAAGVSSPHELFLELAVTDIQRAADALRPIFERTSGDDGFVSIEVPPSLADDTEGTVAAAQMLWDRIERPNIMVKIPATPEGLPAIRRSIAAGLNINVTLIFALAAYEAVAEAYVAGLEERDRQGLPLRCRSVASFFVSRVDTAVDRLLEAGLAQRPGDPELEGLLGTAAIANARLAYERFEQIFRGTRFAPLRERGAAVQRPLWASTSSKNPRYPDVVYAEALVGPDTVDTMPPATIEAFADHGHVDGDTVRSGYEEAHQVMERLAAAGIDVERVTQELLDAGVEAFAASYDSLIRSIALKSDAIHGGLGGRQHLQLGAHRRTVLEESVAAAERGVVRRIWQRDPDLWKPGDSSHGRVIRNRLGWLDVADRMAAEVPGLEELAAEAREEGTDDVVLLGMGGSSLCPEVLRTAFGRAEGFPALHVLDTTDPAAISGLTASLQPERALFVVASKSGGTVETLSHLAHFWRTALDAGVAEPGRRFLAITDPGTSLAALARDRGFRRVFENPPDIGGRYSALSFFGLVPAALAGIDVGLLLQRARAMAHQCAAETYPTLNCGLVLGVTMGALWERGLDKVTILAPPAIAEFGLWAEQLIAESTGKEGRGLVPVAGEPLGDPGVYGEDRLFVALRLGADEGFDGGVAALRAAGRPVLLLELRDLHDLGAEFLRWEFATAVAGSYLGIDPFDEPNVTESKENTHAVLQRYEAVGSLPDDPADAERLEERLGALLERVRPGDYVSLQAYVTPDGATAAALRGLRVAIRDRFRVATTVGFGPRFLHSTGQLHKGGPDTGVFVQITADDGVDVPIPGQPYTFGVLKRAQARGDLQSLRDHDRRVEHLHLGADPRTALDRLTGSIRAAEARP